MTASKILRKIPVVGLGRAVMPVPGGSIQQIPLVSAHKHKHQASQTLQTKQVDLVLAEVSMGTFASGQQAEENRKKGVAAVDFSGAQEQAKRDGYRDGMAQAQHQIEAEVEKRTRLLQQRFDEQSQRQLAAHHQALARLDSLLTSIDRAAPAQFSALETQVLELAFAALCRILGPQVSEESGNEKARANLLAALIQQGMAQLRGQALFKVRLHPADQQALGNDVSVQSLLQRHGTVTLQADASLAPLSPRLHTELGQLDIGLLTQLDRLRQAWQQVDGLSIPMSSQVG